VGVFMKGVLNVRYTVLYKKYCNPKERSAPFEELQIKTRDS